MKALFSILAFLVISDFAFSQTQATVTINTTGNRNKQILVDSKSYTINNTGTTTVQPIVISDLLAGQHTLQLVRNNQSNRNPSAKTNFTLREGYDLTLTVGADGSISSSEKRVAGMGNNARGQLPVAAFNTLYTKIKNKTTSTARATALETEFTTLKKKLTSKQASQLIQLVSSESLRLKLSKQSYTKVSDQQNFSLVTNLLNSTTNRNELNAYIASSVSAGTSDEVIVLNERDPISEAKFKVIYNEVVAEPASDRTYYLNNFFSNDLNYYSAAQAKQLIELITVGQDRFGLAKTAYRGVTDRENYSAVYSLVPNLSDRSELAAYINTYDNNNPRPAMMAADFDKLYQSIYSQNSSNTRYTSINTAFTTPGNYFTVAQTKKLIPLVSAETSRLQLAKAAYKILVDRSNYAQFNDFLSSTASRNEFSSYVSIYNNNVVAGSSLAMSETDYNKLYQTVTNSWTASSKFNLISDAFKSSTTYFTVSQVKQLLNLIGSESDKLSLAKNSYDNIVDPVNYTQLYDLFPSTASKNDLAGFVANVQSGTTTIRVPMSETEFTGIYNNVKMNFGLGAKYSALTVIFNKESNYFTVTQAKQLIQMVSLESNRLELAKLSYNNITDPTNFSQLYDIFSSQTSKNELMAYVNSNAYNN